MSRVYRTKLAEALVNEINYQYTGKIDTNGFLKLTKDFKKATWTDIKNLVLFLEAKEKAGGLRGERDD